MKSVEISDIGKYDQDILFVIASKLWCFSIILFFFFFCVQLHLATIYIFRSQRDECSLLVPAI